MNWKYLFMTLLVIGAGSFGYFFLHKEPAEGNPVIDTYGTQSELNTVEKIIEEENTADSGTAWSCDAMVSEGVCIELTGSIYKTGNTAEMSCADTGDFVKKPCPTSPYGGCKTGAGTNVEMISYMYPNTENEVDNESIKYAKMACEMNGLGVWTYNSD